MTTSVEQESVDTEALQDDDAAFEAGIAQARGDESPAIPTKTESPTGASMVNESAEPDATAEPEKVEPEFFLDNLTKEDVKRLLTKAGEVDVLQSQLQKAHGRLGELNMRVQQIQQGSGRKLTAETFSRLKEAGYDDLAEKLAEDLSGVSLGGAAPPQQVDLSPLRQEIQQIKEQHEMKLLSLRHRTWQQDVNGDEFRLWSQTLSAEDRQQLNESWDAMFIGDKLDDYKAWRERGVQAQASQQQKQQRLEAAVTPKGIPSPAKAAIDDEEAFLAGIKSVRGR
jgi:hypothetical protein